MYTIMPKLGCTHYNNHLILWVSLSCLLAEVTSFLYWWIKIYLYINSFNLDHFYICVAVASWDRLELSPGRSGFDPRCWRMSFLNLHFDFQFYSGVISVLKNLLFRRVVSALNLTLYPHRGSSSRSRPWPRRGRHVGRHSATRVGLGGLTPGSTRTGVERRRPHRDVCRLWRD